VNLSLSRSDDVPLAWLDGATDTLEEIGRSLDPIGAGVNIVVVGDAYIRDINARFRGKDRATDVISFSYLDDDTPGDDDLAGEVYISHDMVKKEADDLGVDVSHLFLRLGVHGLLHIQGYEHDTDDDARRMEVREREILAAHLGEVAAALLF